MAAIFPFAALRPTPPAAAAVASVPYDVVSTEEARGLAERNPLSFLHVSRPEIDLPAGTDPHADAVYDLAAKNLARLQAAAPLIMEDAASFYVYRLHMGGHVQSGIAGCFSVDEYNRGVIKKHENTRPDKEDDRTRHMLAIRAQTGPVFLIYRTSSDVDAVVTRATAGPTLFDITAADGVRHQIWRVADSDAPAIVTAFAAIDSLYIADGHHRAASAARAQRSLATSGAGEHDRFLAVAFPNTQMQVLAYNRVVRDLHGLTANEFLASLKRRLTVTDDGEASPRRKGEVAIYLAGQWRTLQFSAGEPALDVDLLQSAILEPILGIQDVRTDQRVDFVGGIRGTNELEQLVDAGKFAVAFSLYPVSVDDLMRVSDASGIMPPKSTWFEPKLRDGLLSHVIG